MRFFADEQTERIELSPDLCVFRGRLPPPLHRDEQGFELLWALRPERYHTTVRAGVEIQTPRWQQAFGRDYAYSGSVNRARPVPAELTPLLRWVKACVDERLNGLLVNWYDLALQHYIGRHKDSPTGLVPGAPIVSVSFGAARTLVLSRNASRVPVELDDHSVFVLPWEVNARWNHEVPKRGGVPLRRVSVTFRAFADAAADR